MSIEAAFFPQGTVNIAATTTSQYVQLPATNIGSYQTANGDALLVYNSGTTVGFVAFGSDNTIVATTSASFPIPPGYHRLVGAGQYVTYAAAVLASGTGTIYFSRGCGHVY